MPRLSVEIHTPAGRVDVKVKLEVRDAVKTGEGDELSGEDVTA